MLSNLVAQIRGTIQKHRMLALRDRVLAGVSGGADSVCLAVVLKELGFDVAVAHVMSAEDVAVGLPVDTIDNLLVLGPERPDERGTLHP